MYIASYNERASEKDGLQKRKIERKRDWRDDGREINYVRERIRQRRKGKKTICNALLYCFCRQLNII